MDRKQLIDTKIGYARALGVDSDFFKSLEAQFSKKGDLTDAQIKGLDKAINSKIVDKLNSDFIGEVGYRQIFSGMIAKHTLVNGEWGTKANIYIVTGCGNLISMSTSAKQFIDLDINTTVEFEATIKNHIESHLRKQRRTVVERPTLYYSKENS